MRAIYLPKFYVSKAFPFLSVSAGSALPLAFPEVFSNSLTMLGKVVGYNFSSLYGPLLNSSLAPVVAVVASVVSTPLVGSFDMPLFSQRVGGVEIGTYSSFTSSVISAKAGLQSHTQHLSDMSVDQIASTSTSSWIPAFAEMTKERMGMTEGERGLTFGSTQHPLTLTQTASHGVSMPADVMSLGISTVAPAQVAAQSHTQTLAAAPATPLSEELMGQWTPILGEITEARETDGDSAHVFKDNLQKIINKTVEKIKIILKRKTLQKQLGITAAFFEKDDWMKWEHIGWSEAQKTQTKDLWMVVFTHYALLNCAPCHNDQNGNSDNKDDINFPPILNEKFQSVDRNLFPDSFHDEVRLREILIPLERVGIRGKDIDNLTDLPWPSPI
jgi:hypothetical protein